MFKTNPIILLLCAAALLVSCERDTGASAGNDGVAVNLIPSAYGGGGPLLTRAVDLGNTGDASHADYYYNGFLGEPALTALPVGTTVWLTYRRGDPVDPAGDLDDPDNFTWDPMELHAYVVQNAAGYNALYPIRADEMTEGGVTYMYVGDITYTAPLFLKDGYYQFRMVSPANRIVKSDLRMQVDNGMYVYSNDERYEQTRSKIIRVHASGEGVQNIVLNPMINQTARFQISIRPGSNVSSMEMMSQGIEIAGLQNPEKEANGVLDFSWNSMDIADTLKMKKGDKYCRTFIKEFTRVGDRIVGETGILPTDAMSTTTVITVNMAVNGIPTQYLVVINQRRYFHGHSYRVDLEVGLDGDIRVMNWSSQSWAGEMKFK